MTLLFILGFCAILILVLAGSLKLQPWKSRAHMVNAEWLDTSEKFALISRWGAQF